MAIKRLPDMRLNDVSRKLRKLGYKEYKNCFRIKEVKK